MMASEITLKQLSEISGFSKSTVSKSLRNSNEISDITKRKICKLAKKFNYIPNNSAIALRIRKTRIIALIVPEIASVFYSKIISKMQGLAFDKGYRILILESLFCENKELECINTIRDGCVDGMVIIRSLQKSSNSCSRITRLPSTYIMPTVPTVIQKVNEFNGSIHENNDIAEKSIITLLARINNRKITS